MEFEWVYTKKVSLFTAYQLKSNQDTKLWISFYPERREYVATLSGPTKARKGFPYLPVEGISTKSSRRKMLQQAIAWAQEQLKSPMSLLVSGLSE